MEDQTEGNNFRSGNIHSGINGSPNIINSGSTVLGTRLDREYLWEGEEMMFEDIIASTHPLNYNPVLYNRKFDYDSHYFGNQGRTASFPGFNDDSSIIEDLEELEDFGEEVEVAE
jgi:hypothetical protein